MCTTIPFFCHPLCFFELYARKIGPKQLTFTQVGILKCCAWFYSSNPLKLNDIIVLMNARWYFSYFKVLVKATLDTKLTHEIFIQIQTSVRLLIKVWKDCYAKNIKSMFKVYEVRTICYEVNEANILLPNWPLGACIFKLELL